MTSRAFVDDKRVHDQLLRKFECITDVPASFPIEGQRRDCYKFCSIFKVMDSEMVPDDPYHSELMTAGREGSKIFYYIKKRTINRM